MLARDGHVVRTYGGAVERSVREKCGQHAAEKDEVARMAADLIQDGEVIVLDAGTTTGRLATYLAHRELTVVTNGLTAILALAESTSVELIVLGGRLRHPNEAIVGASVIEQLRHIGADRVFLGTDGLSEERGLCSPSLEQAHLKYAMLHCARNAYVLVDRSKLGQEPYNYWTPLDRSHTVLANLS
jgi:DeoR/GlpR family transcriptional regulator of sugar metabolism